MITEFSKQTQKTLKSYVYTYTDPRNGEVFYVGKGENNRCFAHLKRDDGFKTRLDAIAASGLEARIDILAAGLDDTDAFKIEAAVIATYGVENLLNKAKGKYIRKRSIEEIERENSREKIDVSDLPYNVLSICINQTYPGIDPYDSFALYEITRACWSFKRGPAEGKDVQKTPYVLATYNDRVLEVYEVAAWYECNAVMHSRGHYIKTRWAFVGNRAEESVRKLFVNKLLPSRKPGEANPLKLYRKQAQ